MSGRPLRIGLETTNACELQATGVTRYGLCLAEALARRPDARVRTLTHIKRMGKRYRRPASPGVAASWYAAGALLPLHRLDLLHGLNCRVPGWSGVPSVITVHDLMWEIPIAAEWGETPSTDGKASQRLARALGMVERVIAVSATTRDDLVAHRGIDLARIDVVWEGVDPCFGPQALAEAPAVRARLGLERPYVLHVGSVMRRKNLVRLAEAFAATGLAANFDLVLAGRDGGDLAAVQAAAGRLGLGSRLRHLRYVAGEDLPGLYAGAAALAFPSLYEGFGLPVLEGMACGVSVLTSDRSGTREVAAGHAELIDPLSVESIAEGLKRAVALPRERVAAAAAHARACTWDLSAERTMACYRRVLGR